MFKRITIQLDKNGNYQLTITKTFAPEYGGGEQDFHFPASGSIWGAVEVLKQCITVSPATPHLPGSTGVIQGTVGERRIGEIVLDNSRA